MASHHGQSIIVVGGPDLESAGAVEEDSRGVIGTDIEHDAGLRLAPGLRVLADHEDCLFQDLAAIATATIVREDAKRVKANLVSAIFETQRGHRLPTTKGLFSKGDEVVCTASFAQHRHNATAHSIGRIVKAGGLHHN